MKLYHATKKSSVKSILKRGLLVSHADKRAKILGCWLHTAAKTPWAILHTMRKHHVTLRDVVILEVNVPRATLTRFRRGLWYSQTNINFSRIAGKVAAATEFSKGASQ